MIRNLIVFVIGILLVTGGREPGRRKDITASVGRL